MVHGSDGLDEITLTGPTFVAALENGKIRTFEVTPEEAGLARVSGDALKGGDADANAIALQSVLDGMPSPFRDVALLNAAAALIVAGRAKNLKEGVALGTKSLDSGAAAARLKRLVAVSNADRREPRDVRHPDQDRGLQAARKSPPPSAPIRWPASKRWRRPRRRRAVSSRHPREARAAATMR